MGLIDFVDNQQTNALVNYNFMLRVEALYDIPCKSIRAFTRENEYEIIQEGGLNDYVHMRRKPISKPYTFQVERYCGVNAYFDPLPNGAQLILPVLLLVTRNAGDFRRTKRVFIFTGCTVMSKEYGALDAERSGLLTELATISYREMICFDWPVDLDKDKWAFKGNEIKGNEKLSATSVTSGKASGINNRSRADGEKEAKERKWAFSGVDPKGNGKINRQVLNKPDVDGTPAPMASKWKFNGDDPKGNGVVNRLQPADVNNMQKPDKRKWPPDRSAKDINNFLRK